jgi:uncharacterized protein YodC (DUF2158 family)
MAKFKAGDTVTLKSGSDLMTVDKAGLGEDGKDCICTWFDDKNKLRTQFVSEDSLDADDGTVNSEKSNPIREGAS